MSSTRADLERIVNDPPALKAFEDKLKKNYNYQLIAFWVNIRNLRVAIDVSFCLQMERQGRKTKKEKKKKRKKKEKRRKRKKKEKEEPHPV
jgi:hypothetical protein